MKKILLAVSIIVITTSVVHASMTPEDLRSEAYMKNAGYSTDMIQSVQQSSNELEIKEQNIFQKVGFKLWNYIDPSSPKARTDRYHDTKMYSYYGDL